MSTTEPEVDDLKQQVTDFLRANFPQIQMHGGSAAITQLDPDEGTVTVRLGGACSGCGISPMTIQALKKRLPKNIPEIETVYADTGEDGKDGMTPFISSGDDDNNPAPF